MARDYHDAGWMLHMFYPLAWLWGVSGFLGQLLASHQALTQILSKQEIPEGLATNEPMS